MKDNQERDKQAFLDRLEELKETMDPHDFEKVLIIAEQLGRF